MLPVPPLLAVRAAVAASPPSLGCLGRLTHRHCAPCPTPSYVAAQRVLRWYGHWLLPVREAILARHGWWIRGHGQVPWVVQRSNGCCGHYLCCRCCRCYRWWCHCYPCRCLHPQRQWLWKRHGSDGTTHVHGHAWLSRGSGLELATGSWVQAHSATGWALAAAGHCCLRRQYPCCHCCRHFRCCHCYRYHCLCRCRSRCRCLRRRRQWFL